MINTNELFKRYTKEQLMNYHKWLQSPHGQEVYNLFKQYAYDWREAGHYKCGASLIVNRIRWECSITAHLQGYKLRNEYAPLLARQLVTDDPSFSNFFSFHGESKSKSEVI